MNDQTEQENETRDPRHKRLPGLWSICALFGLMALWYWWLFPAGTFVGRLFLGGFGVAFLSAALLLWCRVAWSWAAAIILWLIQIGLMVVFAGELPTFGILLAYGAVSIFVVGYLLKRKKCFSGKLGPPSLFLLFIVTVGLVVATFYLNTDATRRSFPPLDLRQKGISPEGNGYSVFREIKRQDLCRSEKGNTTGRDVHWVPLPPSKSNESEDWLPEARSLLQRNTVCLAKLKKMLARPHFLTRPAEKSRRKQTDTILVSNLGRLLVLRSAVLLSEGDIDESLSRALQAVQLGLLWEGGGREPIYHQTGLSIVQLGLRQVRRIAADGKTSTDTLRTALDKIPVLTDFREAFEKAVRRSFYHEQAQMEMFSNLESLHKYSNGIARGKEETGKEHSAMDTDGQYLLANLNPIFKINMTVNHLGDHYTRLMNLAEYSRFQAFDPKAQVEFSVLNWLRNPLGGLAVTRRVEVHRWWIQDHWRTIAAARLTRTYLAIRLRHLKYGELPGELGDLMPGQLMQVPEDPFSGNKLGYDPTTKPPIVYSVGPDGRKDRKTSARGSDDLNLELDFADR